MRTSHVPVLVVGAGAAGTLVTLELARHGVRVRTVDRLPRPTTDSNAFVVHAGTLELLERLDERLVARFLERGVRCNGYALHVVDSAGRRSAMRPVLDFATLDSRYPFLLTHRQSETERYLREYTGAHFGVSPDWGASCVAVRPVDDGVVATLESDGVREEVHCHYLVACDGAASSVREGSTVDRQAQVDSAGVIENLDVRLEGLAEDDEWVHACTGPDHFLVVARLPGGFHRLQRGVERATPGDATAVARELQRSVDQHFDGVRLGEVVAHARWQRRTLATPDYRRGRVFFVGDAAHGHSRASGLDLDRALQDASNLAWKLAFVVKGLAHPELLASYEAERRPIDAGVSAAADDLHGALTGRGGPGASTDALAARCAGLAFDYRATAVAPVAAAPLAGPAVGERAADAPLGRGRTLLSLARRPSFTLLGLAAAESGMRPLEAVLAPLGKRFAAALAVRVVGPSAALAQRYGASETDRLWLLRPDGYVAVKCAVHELALLEAWLAERLVG